VDGVALPTPKQFKTATPCEVLIVMAVVVPLVWNAKLPVVSPAIAIAVPAVVPALIVDAII
jgi:hypothetical protein